MTIKSGKHHGIVFHSFKVFVSVYTNRLTIPSHQVLGWSTEFSSTF